MYRIGRALLRVETERARQHFEREALGDAVHILVEDAKKKYLNFIKAELAPRYAEFIGHEIQKA